MPDANKGVKGGVLDTRHSPPQPSLNSDSPAEPSPLDMLLCSGAIFRSLIASNSASQPFPSTEARTYTEAWTGATTLSTYENEVLPLKPPSSNGAVCNSASERSQGDSSTSSLDSASRTNSGFRPSVVEGMGEHLHEHFEAQRGLQDDGELQELLPANEVESRLVLRALNADSVALANKDFDLANVGGIHHQNPTNIEDLTLQAAAMVRASATARSNKYKNQEPVYATETQDECIWLHTPTEPQQE
ncbi:MAG: hypothetical protein Q9163_001096 [Psora crenata]